MAYRGEKVCDFSDLPVDMCGHCTGSTKSYDESLREEHDVDDPDMWRDDD